MTGNQALVQAVPILAAAGIETAPRDARRLLAHAMGCASDRLSLMLAEPLDDTARQCFDGLIARRAARVPVSHLIGGRYFFDHWFEVTADVLDPRPETEILVQRALAEPFSKVLDLGTGSGAIVLSLLAAMQHAKGVGSDLSEKALDVAARNATVMKVSDRVTWLQSDWFSGVDGRFDLIVSNPPYIAAAEMRALTPEVRDHEPRMALTDNADGLTAYRAISVQAGAHLMPNGRLLVEIGPSQGVAVTDLFRAAGLGDICVHPDLDGRDRVVAARNPG